MQKAIKDLRPDDRVLTIDGQVAVIDKVQRSVILEGSPPPFEVTWTVGDQKGRYLGSGNDKVQLAE